MWEPMLGWIGRYRNTETGAFGYKPNVVTGPGTKNGTSDQIRPYQCSKCKGWAVAKDVTTKGKKVWVCAQHRLPNQ